MDIRLPKPNRNPIWVLSLVLACIVCTVGGYAFLTAPRYIALDIEVPDSYLPRGNWTLTTLSTYKFTDTQSRYFVWRQEAEVRTKPHDPQSPFDSWLSLKEYFDNHLADDEWTLYQSESYDPCINFLPEAKFLPRGEDGYLAFRKPGTVDFAAEPTVCLAIWPSRIENENVNGYYVVILTVNPSPMTALTSQITLW